MGSALLMLERGYNTLKRVLAFKMSDGSKQQSSKQEQKQIEDLLHKEEEELNAKERAFEEAPPDSRPSTAQSNLALTDAEIEIMAEKEEEGHDPVTVDRSPNDSLSHKQEPIDFGCLSAQTQ